MNHGKWGGNWFHGKYNNMEIQDPELLLEMV
jgi:hypothetical protein